MKEEQFIRINTYGDKFYFKYKELMVKHRTDGPAVEWADGGREWYVDGKYHRIDGPAKEYNSGHKEWRVNGKLHRTDGPAYEGANGTKGWYIDGVKLTEEEFKANGK